MVQQRISIITLGVKDLKQSTSFYETKFGWKRLAISTKDISFFKLNGILLSLYPREKLAEDAETPAEGHGFRGMTIAYNTRSEEDVDTIIGDLRQKGVHIVKEPQKVFWGGYSSYVADPDGHLWEIAYNPYMTIDDLGNVET